MTPSLNILDAFVEGDLLKDVFKIAIVGRDNDSVWVHGITHVPRVCKLWRETWQRYRLFIVLQLIERIPLMQTGIFRRFVQLFERICANHGSLIDCMHKSVAGSNRTLSGMHIMELKDIGSKLWKPTSNRILEEQEVTSDILDIFHEYLKVLCKGKVSHYAAQYKEWILGRVIMPPEVYGGPRWVDKAFLNNLRRDLSVPLGCVPQDNTRLEQQAPHIVEGMLVHVTNASGPHISILDRAKIEIPSNGDGSLFMTETGTVCNCMRASPMIMDDTSRCPVCKRFDRDHAQDEAFGPRVVLCIQFRNGLKLNMCVHSMQEMKTFLKVPLPAKGAMVVIANCGASESVLDRVDKHNEHRSMACLRPEPLVFAQWAVYPTDDWLLMGRPASSLDPEFDVNKIVLSDDPVDVSKLVESKVQYLDQKNQLRSWRKYNAAVENSRCMRTIDSKGGKVSVMVPTQPKLLVGAVGRVVQVAAGWCLVELFKPDLEAVPPLYQTPHADLEQSKLWQKRFVAVPMMSVLTLEISGLIGVHMEQARTMGFIGSRPPNRATTHIHIDDVLRCSDRFEPTGVSGSKAAAYLSNVLQEFVPNFKAQMDRFRKS